MIHTNQYSEQSIEEQALLFGENMKLCYCDESGTGDEPIAVMVGIVVDAQRMHITKEHWGWLLANLSRLAGKEITELHTRNFYAGNGIWRGLTGQQRSDVLAEIFRWLCERKHHVVYTSVNKKTYHQEFALQRIPDELNTLWRFLGFHLVLAMQKHCQREDKNKGHTLFVFDNEEREQMRFTDVLLRPPDWSDEYYGRSRKQEKLDQIIDVPYFGDSNDVALIQLADVASFFLRRYAEIKENLIPAKYDGEESKVEGWVNLLASRCIGTSMIYPKTGRSKAEEIFFRNASTSIRSLC